MSPVTSRPRDTRLAGIGSVSLRTSALKRDCSPPWDPHDGQRGYPIHDFRFAHRHINFPAEWVLVCTRTDETALPFAVLATCTTASKRSARFEMAERHCPMLSNILTGQGIPLREPVEDVAMPEYARILKMRRCTLWKYKIVHTCIINIQIDILSLKISNLFFFSKQNDSFWNYREAYDF